MYQLSLQNSVHWLLLTQKKDTLEDVIVENLPVLKNTVSVSSQVLVVLIYANVKHVKIKILGISSGRQIKKLN